MRRVRRCWFPFVLTAAMIAGTSGASITRSAARASGAAVVSEGAPASALPQALERALDRKDPLALADSTLPRLADLDSVQRVRVAERMAGWDLGRRVAAWAFL